MGDWNYDMLKQKHVNLRGKKLSLPDLRSILNELKNFPVESINLSGFNSISCDPIVLTFRQQYRTYWRQGTVSIADQARIAESASLGEYVPSLSVCLLRSFAFFNLINL
jgi:hypothetical protein